MSDPVTLEKDDKEKEEGGGIANRLIKSRTILVSEQISDTIARKVHNQLILMQEDDEKAMITVYVNSPGGSADSGFAIFDALRFFKPLGGGKPCPSWRSNFAMRPTADREGFAS